MIFIGQSPSKSDWDGSRDANDRERQALPAEGGIAILSGWSYPPRVKGITIKLPESMLERLRREARATGRSLAALVRDRLEAPAEDEQGSVFLMTSDLAGSLGGSRRAATNERRRFRKP